MRSNSRSRGAAALAACALALTFTAPAGAAPAAGAALRCEASIIGRTAAGQHVLGPVTCTAGSLATLAVGTTHYNGINFTGSSFFVAIPCDGGWINMPGGFVNSISSTSSDCTVRHHDGQNLNGASQTISSGNLTTLDNRTNSAIYY